ncbi:MAG TPA: hypothetical protein VN841_21115 [Bryobacteraceae bacterium]|nr:hypothetical protein [Bryobacteraceae bacterium]
MGAPTEPKAYRLLVYGIETKGLQIPRQSIKSGKYTLEFAHFKGTMRFQEFDGVILFQGTFESFERVSIGYRSLLKHAWEPDELDRRTKESLALIEKGGIVCMLLTDPFIDFDDRRDFRGMDLSKRLLSGFEIHRESFASRIPIVRSKINELGKFFELYGAAWSLLYGDKASKTLASANGGPVSVVARGSVFAIPTLIPKSTDEAVEEYFTILADGVVSLWERLKEDLPEWAAEYRFPDETTILATKLKLSGEISEIEARLKRFDRLKRALVLQGEPLVDAVMEVFNDILPLKAKREEAFREDLMLVDSAGNLVALAEVKGVSRGVAREHVNQADSHRERNALPPDFPSLLIINTNMKTSMSVADKDQNVAAEQVQHAARNNILVLRTLDLLNLASLCLGGKLKEGRVIELLTKSSGWLKVGDTTEVLSS